MVQRYKFVRIRLEDYNKIVNEKKATIEHDLHSLTGKKIKIKDTQLFSIAANSVWDLGEAFQTKIIKAVRIKKGEVRL